MKAQTNEKQEERRTQIIDAGWECFIQYGFAKTSMDDIAKKAGVSRPLIYLQFKNKDEIFVEALRQTTNAEIAAAKKAAAADLNNKETLAAIYEELVVRNWARLHKTHGGVDMYAECMRLFPQIEKDYMREVLKLLVPILGDKDVAELFVLCVDGLYGDQPTVPTLRKRIKLLVDQFVKN
jgi:AcrR family transcriptional regulator